MFVCHDYGADGKRPHAWETTIAEQRASNIHVGDGISEDEFVAMREARDRTLSMPTLILPSIQVNMRAGHLPPPKWPCTGGNILPPPACVGLHDGLLGEIQTDDPAVAGRERHTLPQNSRGYALGSSRRPENPGLPAVLNGR